MPEELDLDETVALSAEELDAMGVVPVRKKTRPERRRKWLGLT